MKTLEWGCIAAFLVTLAWAERREGSPVTAFVFGTAAIGAATKLVGLW